MFPEQLKGLGKSGAFKMFSKKCKIFCGQIKR